MKPALYVARLCQWFLRHPWTVLVIGVCLLAEIAFNAYVPLAFQAIVDDAILPRDAGALHRVLITLGVATLLATALSATGDFLHAKLSTRVLTEMRVRLFRQLQNLSPFFHQKHTAGDIGARFSTDLASVGGTFETWIGWGWKPLLDVIAYNLVLFTLDWRLALLAQLLWPFVLVGPKWITPRAGVVAAERKTKEADVLVAVDEAVAGRQVVNAFGLESEMLARFIAKAGALASTTFRGAIFGAALERSAGIGAYVVQLIVLACGATLALKSEVSLGELVAFYAIYNSLATSLLYLAQYVPSLINSSAGLARVEEFLAHRSVVPERADAEELPPFRDTIRLRDYVYQPEPGITVLDRISLTIRHGDYVAVVGPSGTGKSTLLHAILRNFDPVSGAVEIDGRDLRNVSRASLIRQCGVVFQDSFLYDASVRENVRLGRLDATDTEIELACRDAEIHDAILAMPRGYDSPVGERGSRLSGGERQRIAIARALVRNPRILILDEATAALDPGTEAAVHLTLRRLARDRTVIAVTHRLAATVDCDRVLVLNKGRVVEEGAPDHLRARGGLYTTLWQKQTGIQTSSDGLQAKITAERLKQIPILSELDDTLLTELARHQFSTENVPENRDIIREGEHGNRFYIIARGRVDVLRRQASEISQRVAVLEDGDYFGELALMHDTPRTATVRTLVPCTLLTLRRHDFQSLLRQSPAFLDKLTQSNATRASAA